MPEQAKLCPPNLLPTFHPETDDVLVVVETPKGERSKYKYDESLHTFALSTVLPEGATFPFDFGFIPRTRGDDGDPIDVLLLIDAPVPMGCVVKSRLIGVIEAEQTEHGRTERNDRLVALACEAVRFDGIRALKELSKPMIDQIEQFFENYNRIKGKQFKLIAYHGPKKADALLKEGQKRFRKKRG